jgi:hypothetical protein
VWSVAVLASGLSVIVALFMIATSDDKPDGYQAPSAVMKHSKLTQLSEAERR